MKASFFCETCGETHEYNMYHVVDVVRCPDLKVEFINRNSCPFRCATCGSKTGLEKHMFFVYWAEDWTGLVIPSVPGTSKKWIQNWAEFLISYCKPDREGLPATAYVFGNLDVLLGVIKLLECDEVKESNGRKVLKVDSRIVH